MSPTWSQDMIVFSRYPNFQSIVQDIPGNLEKLC